jgi:hypothetical protein
MRKDGKLRVGGEGRGGGRSAQEEAVHRNDVSRSFFSGSLYQIGTITAEGGRGRGDRAQRNGVNKGIPSSGSYSVLSLIKYQDHRPLSCFLWSPAAVVVLPTEISYSIAIDAQEVGPQASAEGGGGAIA